jgi:hypothetical protein
VYIARKEVAADAGADNEGGGIDGSTRELHLTQLQCYARESMDELDMLKQVLMGGRNAGYMLPCIYNP